MKAIIKNISATTIKLIILIGGIIGVGILPCSDCGAPIIFHIWPIAGLLAIAQMIRRRKDKSTNQENNNLYPNHNIQVSEKDIGQK